MRVMAAAVGGPRRTVAGSAPDASWKSRTIGGQLLRWPCTLTGGSRRTVRDASSSRSSISRGVQRESVMIHLGFGPLAVVLLAQLPHEFAAGAGEPGIGLVEAGPARGPPATA